MFLRIRKFWQMLGECRACRAEHLARRLDGVQCAEIIRRYNVYYGHWTKWRKQNPMHPGAKNAYDILKSPQVLPEQRNIHLKLLDLDEVWIQFKNQHPLPYGWSWGISSLFGPVVGKDMIE